MSLTRSLRGRDLAALTINAVLGAGIFGLPGRLYALTGVWSLLAFAACAMFALMVALCFAEVGSRFNETGGPYLYASATFGPGVAFEVGWLMWLARVSAFAANSNLLLGYLGVFGLPIQNGAGRVIALVILVFGLAAINIAGIRNASFVTNLFTLGKLLPIVIFCIGGAFALAPARLIPGPLPTPDSFSAAVLLLVYAFTGFEMTVVPGGEMRDPRRSLPRALLGAIAVVTLIYLAIDAVCIGVLPELATSTRPVADAAQRFLGSKGTAIVTLGIAVSILGNLHVTILAASRLPFAMAERRQLPGILTHTSPRFRSPDVAIASTAAVVLGLALASDFMGGVAISTIARLLFYASTCAALPVLRRRSPHPAPFEVPGGVWISAAALLITAWLLFHAPVNEVIAIAWAVVVGSVISLAAAPKRRPAT